MGGGRVADPQVELMGGQPALLARPALRLQDTGAHVGLAGAQTQLLLAPGWARGWRGEGGEGFEALVKTIFEREACTRL